MSGVAPTKGDLAVLERATAYSADGYYANVDYSTNTLKITAYAPNGTKFVLGTLAATDRNGNVESLSSGGNPALWYDPLSTTTRVLAWDYSHEPSYDTYTYTGESGNETVTKHFTQYYLASGPYGCGTTQFVATSQTIWTTLFSRPDGTSYTIGYEQTPGKTSAYTTGRINKLILPTGGTITISYNGSNYGMNCDGSTSGMTITSPDGTWTYTHTQPSGTYYLSTTTVTDPSGNKTVYTFTQASSISTPYEVQRQVYTGASTLLETITTCYNGQSANCATAPNSFTSISRITKTTTVTPNSYAFSVDTFYDTYARVTEADETNWGTPTPGAIFRKTLTTYGSYNGSGCNSLSGSYILSLPCTISVTDANGNLSAETTFVRDSHGNPTSISRLVKTNPNTWLSQSYTFNANGTVNTFTDTNGDVYSYTYGAGACNGAFATSVSEPASLSKSMAWNCDGAVMTSSIDEAGKTTTIDYTGECFWRPDYVQDAMGYRPSLNYSPTTYESIMLFSGSSADNLTTFDGLGRVHVSQKRQSPGFSYFDTVETDYNSDGQVSRVTMPYQGTAGQTSAGASATHFTYDGLGRVLTTTDGGGGVATYAYTNNIVTKTVSPAPTGESTKVWKYAYNSGGRLAVVCEVTGNGSDPTCGYFGSDHGYQTQYWLTNLDQIYQVQQSQGSQPQTRGYIVYDSLGRLISETNPESGTKTYTWDTQKGGDLYQTTDADNATVTYTHGAFHRLTSACVGSFCRNFTYDQANAHSGALNVNGRMASASTSGCGYATCPAEYFGYDANGRMTDLWEQTPNSGGLYHVVDQYYANGAINTLLAYQSNGSLIGGLPTMTYGVDGEGRATTVTAGSGQNPVTAASYYTVSQSGQSAGKLANVTYGSGDSDTYSWDSATGRMTQYQFSVNGSNVTGALTWNVNGTLRSLGITDPFNSSNAQTCTYGYDGIARLTSAGCSGSLAWSQTFTYDFVGNLKKNGSLSFQPNYTDANGNTNNRYYSGLTGLSYDYDGNLTNDSFHTYTWDAFGGVTKIDSTNVVRDAFGRAVEFNGGTTREFLYSPVGVNLAKMNGQTLDTARVPLPGGNVASYHSSGFNAYGHADWLGTTRFGSTSTRTKDADWAVAPFGEIYAGGSTSYTAFTGKFDDIGSNLFDFPMRGYHSSQGRWISPDPAGLAASNPMNPQTWNRYAYVAGSPLTAIDPSGLIACCTNGVNINTETQQGNGYNTTGGGGGDCLNPGCASSLSARQDRGISLGSVVRTFKYTNLAKSLFDWYYEGKRLDDEYASDKTTLDIASKVISDPTLLSKLPDFMQIYQLAQENLVLDGKLVSLLLKWGACQGNC